MIVVADTGPLHYLILLEVPEILRTLYGRTIIPAAVLRELQSQRTPPVVRGWISGRPDWLEVRELSHPPDPSLAKLDPGEREAIALAEAMRADALILDERNGRREALRRGLRVIGAIRVLDDAADSGLVDLPSAIERLRVLGFYLDDKLMKFVLDRDAPRNRRNIGHYCSSANRVRELSLRRSFACVTFGGAFPAVRYREYSRVTPVALEFRTGAA